jgi:hypothetical protein
MFTSPSDRAEIDTLPCMSQPDLFFGKRHVAEAKALCNSCPQKLPCLQGAIEFRELSGEELEGIHGGLTMEERRKVSGFKRIA